MSVSPHVIYGFGPFRVDPQHASVSRDGQPLALTPKVFEVLLTLVRCSPEAISKDELLQAAWPGRVVEEANLSQSIFVLRKLLGDTHDRRHYIVTLPGKGYRFAADVRTLAADDSDAQGNSAQDSAATDPAVAVQPAEPVTRPSARRLVLAIIGALAVASILLGVAYFTHREARTAVSAFAPAVISEKSVAVLPFRNDTGTENQRYFSDGLSEDLITALSQFSGLKVISRDSAFKFRSSKDSSAKIGQLLGVAHLLEGSVQRAGDEVRITATLVDAASGSVLWSARYDKPYQDLFALQDAITQAVATALQAKLLAAPGVVLQSDRPPDGSLDAYLAFQRGVAYLAVGTEADVRKAISAFGEATRIDPHYAVAYAKLGHTWNGLATKFLGGAAAIQAVGKARAAIDTALRLDPDSALAHQARAFLLMTVDMDWAGAEAEARHELQLSPNSVAAKRMLAAVLSGQGQYRRAHALGQQALAVDPRSAGAYDGLSIGLTALGQLDAARRAIDTAIALQPRAPGYRSRLTIVEVLRGDHEAAMTAAQQELPGSWRDFALALAAQGGSDRATADAALEHLIAVDGGDSAYQVADVYALRRDPDDMFKWLDRAWTSRDPGINALLGDPFILRYRDDPRFAAFCRKIGRPATTDAVAMK